jgi:23S rRNA (uridine2552-2'-O)-methyltransferase
VANYEKPDFWSLKAQKEGYPARSVYKLQEMDEKFGLIKARARILDLGAAPGSWSLYVLRKFGAGAARVGTQPSGAHPNDAPRAGAQNFLAAADLLPLSRRFDQGLFDGDNFLFMQGDFTEAPVREALVQAGPYSLLLCDAAPSTSGNRSLDALRSLALAETALEFVQHLAVGGNLVVKIFQGQDSSTLLARMKEIFNTARAYKPKACRSDSFEVYFIGLGKKA